MILFSKPDYCCIGFKDAVLNSFIQYFEAKPDLPSWQHKVEVTGWYLYNGEFDDTNVYPLTICPWCGVDIS